MSTWMPRSGRLWQTLWNGSAEKVWGGRHSSVVNSCHAEVNFRTWEIHFHFLSFLNTEILWYSAQVVEILPGWRQGLFNPAYSMSCLLMTWWHMESSSSHDIDLVIALNIQVSTSKGNFTIFIRVSLVISQDWFKWWIGADKVSLLWPMLKYD